ncbi:phosphatase PAP2 family protein [Deinococcus seoulensis]|uniref:Phosphatase PAP2 family protein n=1 Tax=Deinococcus seoulensis TaxID=1837379 RepID=A0ABQ2RM89_9DEIO|nr:phosphatase PAP2 family protein [Deinococcus seoulensis]GGR49119.1 phosphatase PAP2 family protein [Deinococcus seoulensis]
MESFWLAVTNLGRDEVFIVALALYTWLVSPRGGRNLGTAFALSYLVNAALKYGLNLPRPFTNDPAAASEAARATAGGPGLPSGHSQMAATLWGGVALQLRRPWVTWAAAALIVLIAASRLVLNVHYPSDVIVGLTLGALFALVAARVTFPQGGALRWAPPLGALIVAALLPAGTPREFAAGLGMAAGFWFVQPRFTPPTTVSGRLIVAVAGLVVVFAVYFGLGALPDGIKEVGLVRALRYALLVLVAAEGVPLLLRRWLPVGPAQAAVTGERVVH